MTKQSSPKPAPAAEQATHPKAIDFPKYKYHPLANLLPMQSEEEQQAMRTVIRVHGKLDEPVWLYEDKILDGRNSYEAHKAEGVIPEFREWDGEYGTPLQFVYVRNVPRRAMTPSQKAAVAAEFLPRFEKEAKERQRQHGKTAPGKKAEILPKLIPGVGDKGEARELAARMFQVNAKYLSDAKKLKEKNLDLYQEVFAGKAKLQEALKKAGLRPLGAKTARKAASANTNAPARTPPSKPGDLDHDGAPSKAAIPEEALSKAPAAAVASDDATHAVPVTTAELTRLLDHVAAVLPALAVLLEEESKGAIHPTKAAVKKLARVLPAEQRKKYKRVLGDLYEVARDLHFRL